jgi:hypothetical protein
MLFYAGWKPRAGQGPEQAEAGLNVFVRWKAPEGLEFKGIWGRAEVVFEATAPSNNGYRCAANCAVIVSAHGGSGHAGTAL